MAATRSEDSWSDITDGEFTHWFITYRYRNSTGEELRYTNLIRTRGGRYEERFEEIHGHTKSKSDRWIVKAGYGIRLVFQQHGEHLVYYTLSLPKWDS